MKRLSLEELKAQNVNVVANLDAIKGGNDVICHCVSHGPEDPHNSMCDKKK